jgi:hypothetical protein
MTCPELCKHYQRSDIVTSTNGFIFLDEIVCKI